MTFLVTIPIYNEEKYVKPVISEVKKHAEHVLVVNDGSTDATGRLLESIDGIEVITHEGNKGYGASLIDAFAHACRCNHEFVITMDCDAQHEPRQIADFAAAAPRADIVSGSRYLLPYEPREAPPEDRRRINTEVTRTINEITGYRLTDAFCGFKAYKLRPLCGLHLTETGYAMPLQLWIHAAKHGLSVLEIPVKMIYGDASRGFGNGLDNSAERLKYYMEVIERERLAPAVGRCCCRRR